MKSDNKSDVVHFKKEHMIFAQFHPDSGGYASVCRMVNPGNSTTIGSGIATYDGCSIDWTMGADELYGVLEGKLRFLTGENFEEVIEATVGDVILIRKGTRVKYEGEKAKVFYALYPVDYRPYPQATWIRTDND